MVREKGEIRKFRVYLSEGEPYDIVESVGFTIASDNLLFFSEIELIHGYATVKTRAYAKGIWKQVIELKE
jgi:hypothetical protein